MLDVYKTVYNLSGQPFRLSPDYRFSFGHQTYNDAKSYLKYAIEQGEGIVAVTGAPGTGKTTLISSLVSELNLSKLKIGVVSNIQLGSGSLLEIVANAFDVQFDRPDHVNILNEFISFLKHQHNLLQQNGLQSQ